MGSKRVFVCVWGREAAFPCTLDLPLESENQLVLVIGKWKQYINLSPYHSADLYKKFLIKQNAIP